MLSYVEDYIIFEIRDMYKEFKIEALKIKYGDDIIKEITLRNKWFVFRNLTVMSKSDSQFFELESHTINGNTLHVQGVFSFPLPYTEDCVIAVDDKGRKYTLTHIADERPVCSICHICMERRVLAADIPLNEVTSIKFRMIYNGIEFDLNTTPGSFTAFADSNNMLYYNEGEYTLTFSDQTLFVHDSSFAKKQERRIIRSLIKNKCKRALYLRCILPRLKKNNSENSILFFANGNLGEIGYNNPQETVEQILSEYQPEKVYVVYDNNNEWLSQYGITLDIDNSLEDQKKLFLINGVFSFNRTWQKFKEPLGWHNKLVKDLYRYKQISCRSSLIPTMKSKEQLENA
jgi:hypothetical protein